MLIGIDASRANQEQKTGVGWYAYHLLQELKKITPEDIRVVLYSDKPLQGDLAELPPNWSVKILAWPPKRLWTQIRLSWEMLWHGPDVLFIPAHVFPLIHPKKTVMTVHDVAASKFPKSYNWFERWYSLWSAKYAVRKLWQVIVPSEFTKKELGSDKIKVIAHGYDKRYGKIENVVDGILQKYNLAKPYIMSLGRLEEKKNTKRIIEAFNLIRQNLEIKLLLVGMHGYGYNEVKVAIDCSPYKNDIFTPGWAVEADIPALMSAAEVFVFPSLYEGFGLPVLEAMACGTAVVASRGSSLEEVGGGAVIYVDSDKVEEISHAVLDLLQKEDLCMLKIKQGYERIWQFSWKKSAQETLQVLLT